MGEGYRHNNAIVAFGKEEPRNKKKDKQEKDDTSRFDDR